MPDHEALQGTFVRTNGIRLHVVQAGAPDGTPVLMLHGFPEFWYGWHRQIDALVAAGCRVWLPDQRGYNLSDKPGGLNAYTLDTLAADAAGLIDAMGGSVTLVGHDWGGVVAWWVAARYPQRVRRLAVLNAPHPSVMHEAVWTNVEQTLRSWYAGFFQLPLLPEALMSLGDGAAAMQMLFNTSRPGTFTDEDVAFYLAAWRQPGALTAMLNWYRAFVQRPVRLTGSVRVHAPTLVIWGSRDAFLTRQLAVQSAALTDEARVVYIDRASHWVQHEEAERVNELLVEFLNEGAPTL